MNITTCRDYKQIFALQILKRVVDGGLVSLLLCDLVLLRKLAVVLLNDGT